MIGQIKQKVIPAAALVASFSMSMTTHAAELNNIQEKTGTGYSIDMDSLQEVPIVNRAEMETTQNFTNAQQLISYNGIGVSGNNASISDNVVTTSSNEVENANVMNSIDDLEEVEVIEISDAELEEPMEVAKDDELKTEKAASEENMETEEISVQAETPVITESGAEAELMEPEMATETSTEATVVGSTVDAIVQEEVVTDIPTENMDVTAIVNDAGQELAAVENTTESITEVPVIDTSATSNEVTTAQSNPGYTAEDLYYLSHIINAEAGSCDETQQLYVGSVVLNRVKSPLFPNTVKDVVLSPGQYSTVGGKRFAAEPSAATVAYASMLLTKGSQLPDHVIFQANFKQGSGTYIEYGGVYYCYK